ncbi:MAG TPA: class I SAM-dependent RNA methyltransferase [Jatrophihabitans sp.]|jgi:tRNA/tmRNA/rRNA uracil-C5-methylase (TrmA/RlmC/RlmD family)|uniref:class I SAM-dependent RNA methyltransferase n=1 Tax=Jatrophihabitans sp. TaxID=1932789 RepID=UPI002EF8F2C5
MDERAGQRAGRQPQPAAAESWLGRRLEVRVEAIAHGGHCVARSAGRVVFVRHALPGETVLAEVTEDRGGSFCRADAVEIRTASPDRVSRPCPYAHPGGCGGCDFQHVSLPGQRALKAAVVAEQLSRLAGLERAVTVQPLDDGDGLGWRRRVRFAVGPAGELGLRAHRSHRVVPLSHCPIGAPGVGDARALQSDWPGLAELEVAVDDRGEVVELAHRSRPARPRRDSRGRHGGNRRPARPVLSTEQLSGPPALRYAVAGREFTVHPAGFWQTHPQAAEVFTATVLRAASARPGERVLDLYAGSGLFTAALASAVTSTGRVLGLEAEPTAVADAGANLADQPWAAVRRATVSAATVQAATGDLSADGVDIVVLDPPRSGAGREVLSAILAAGPRVVIYVACDPAALARDVRIALDAGWQLDELSAFDAFPMTHHVECIAVLRPLWNRS